MFFSWILLFCGLAIITGVKQRIPATGGHDPGSCNKKTHGKVTLVKDRTDDEIILICVKDKNGYKWKSTDGTKNTVGEFFNPGYDCSDILDKLRDAEDGFYWITLKGPNIHKVWCDMSTDGGGFLLIGRKNNSITWTVPSNNKPVDPYGEPHWTSSLGDAPILDFRVQMATREDFKATKAHWSFRLQSKRPLKNLMMTTAGCDQRSAGIGNIAFSTTGKISGMEYNATAFAGCDNGHCCGCYGPVGGTKNYCAQNCKAINGGTVAKNVYTWFWVRSNLPKRVWKQCMDYQVKRDDGKLVSYKLVGHSVVPVEGRCNKASALLHDGIVVVPDSSTAQKVPAIDGLLEYRKDKQELYVRSNKTWDVMAKKKKVNHEINRLENLIKTINTSLSKVFQPKKECFEYKWLRESNRNVKHVTTTYLCDNGLSPGWYRFGGGAGTKLPGSCTPEHRCQGDYTGWMKGSHPTTADGKVKRKVCFSHGSNCCHWSNDIEVIKCGWYYVYKLGPPSKCRARYCGTDN